MANEIKPPRIRLSRRIKKDKVVKVKVKFDHPSLTGLGRADDTTEPRFNRVSETTFLRNMLVYYDNKLISRFSMSSGISDNPLFIFKLKATKEAPLKVVFVDNQGKRWETSANIKFRR